jgi:N-acetylglucosamine-6-phosphate deacetylase
MDHMVRVMAAQSTASLPHVIRMASLTPAERVGIASEVGSLQPGKLADIVVLNNALEVERVFLEGEEFRID